MEDALISPKSFAILSGANLMHADENKTVVAHASQQVEVTTAGEIIVNAIVSKKSGADVYVMLLDGNGEMSGVPVKIAANVITYGHYEEETWKVDNIGEDGKIPDKATHSKIASALFLANDVVFVDFYKEYKDNAIEITISADKFAGYYYLEASTLFRREADGVDLPAEFIIPKAKIQSAFTFAMASSGDPSTFTFTMDALPDYTKFDPTKKVLCAIQVLEADDNYDIVDVEDEGTITYQRVAYDVNNEEGSTKNAFIGYTTSKGKKYKDTDGSTSDIAGE